MAASAFWMPNVNALDLCKESQDGSSGKSLSVGKHSSIAESCHVIHQHHLEFGQLYFDPFFCL